MGEILADTGVEILDLVHQGKPVLASDLELKGTIQQAEEKVGIIQMIAIWL